MFDVSKISKTHLMPIHVHRGPSSVCRNEGSFLDIFYSTSIFRVHHYAGSYQSYFRTKDERRKVEKERFLTGSKIDYGVTYDATFWLTAFIDQVGDRKARYLLKDVGKLSGTIHEPDSVDESKAYHRVPNDYELNERLKQIRKRLKHRKRNILNTKK